MLSLFPHCSLLMCHADFELRHDYQNKNKIFDGQTAEQDTSFSSFEEPSSLDENRVHLLSL